MNTSDSTPPRSFTPAEKDLLLGMHKRGFAPSIIAARIGRCTEAEVEALLLSLNKAEPPAPTLPPAVYPPGWIGDALQIMLAEVVQHHSAQGNMLKVLSGLVGRNPSPDDIQALVITIEREWANLPPSIARPTLHTYIVQYLLKMFIFVPRPTVEKQPSNVHG